MTQRYDTYKDSGVQWLGEIPGHWEVLRIKNICECYGRIGFRGYTTNDFVPEGCGAITISPSNMKDIKMDFSRCSYLSWNKYYESPEIQIKEGDVLFVKTGSTYGKTSYVDYLPTASTINPQIVCFKNHKQSPKFLAFLFNTKVGKMQVEFSLVGGTIPTIAQSKIVNYSFAFPPLSEQRSIVSFLDAKCGKIDEWVTKKQKEVEHLQELKQRVIADAVTRGLNPHVKMKATNIPWLKEIPEHWDCIRLATCILSSVVGSWGVDEKKDGTDILCLRVADFDYNKGIVKEDKLTYRNYEGKLSEEKFFRDGDLLLEKSGGGDIYPVGRVVRFSLNGRIATCSNFIQKLTPNSEIVSSDYLYFWFKMIYSLKINGMYFNQTTGIQNLKVNEYLKQKIYLPPLSEQKQIVSYLDAKTSKIDKLIANITKEIECIKEYKQRLISDVVTGQIKVC